MSKNKHIAFSIEYPNLRGSLVTDIEVFSGNKQIKKKYIAIWDTGATHSVITQRVYDELALFEIDTIPVSGVNSHKIVPVALVNIVLPNKLMVLDHRVTVCELSGIDLLIGMDIIALGDFSISNYEGKTVFSFAIPPFPNRTNLYDKAVKVNGHTK